MVIGSRFVDTQITRGVAKCNRITLPRPFFQHSHFIAQTAGIRCVKFHQVQKR